MKKLLIPLFVIAVFFLGYCVYQETKTKNKEVNRLIQELSSLNIDVSCFNSGCLLT